MPKVSQQYRDARREHILNSARRCFMRDGFHATSMQDLVAEAGLSAGAVYRYFASKDEMIVAITQENLRDAAAMIHTAATQQPGRSVGAVMAEIFAMIQSRDAQDGLGGLPLLAWAEALRNPELAAQFQNLISQMRTDLAEVIRHHQGSANPPAEVPADALAALLVAIVPGYIIQFALIGPAAVADIPTVVQALWP
jgi:TetR/AcrR family transcriptional regulator, transcriptional repressor of aconitase